MSDKGKVCCLFGYRILFIPDLLRDHALLGASERERSAEVFERWIQFVLSLRKHQGTAFALRYCADPDRGEITASIMGRVVVESAHAEHGANLVAAELAANLNSFGMPHQALDIGGLQAVLTPFDKTPSIVEVRQHEEVTPLLTVNQDAYVIHPFPRPAGTWYYPFETMLQQATSVVVSIYLEPTELDALERERLFAAAHISQTLADMEIHTHSTATPRRWRDPQADLVGRVYIRLLRELVEPYLVVVQVASLSTASALAVARSLGAAISVKPVSSPDDDSDLPAGFDLRLPRTPQDKQAALQCFTQLVLASWQTELASNDKKRLVYLMGAQGAASAFRFPIGSKAGIPGIAMRQQAPDFELGPRPPVIASDEVQLGSTRRGTPITVKLEQLTRHTLITGFTGSGKTNTVLSILEQVWVGRKRQGLIPIPFLVIEAAKKEYRGLLEQPGFEDLLVFTLGDETTSPFRLNPFELLPGVRLEAHLNKLQTCFDAALPQFGILPSIIGESLEAVYRDKGWRLSDTGGLSSSTRRLHPTLRDMYEKVIQVSESRGYAGETYHNIRAAAAGRLGSLLTGSRGRMFACQNSLPIDVLLSYPVVLEMNDLSQQDKALTMMFLLMLLREYRELHPTKSIQHLTVVEEAHNVFENVRSLGASEVAADTRAKAVEAFAAMLAEVRAYGEGIVISDQSPEKLAPDAIRNTNLQIAHQLRHRSDRQAISAAMNLDTIQEEYLGKLLVGEAAVFFTGFERATFMKVTNYKDNVAFGEPPNNAVKSRMRRFHAEKWEFYLPLDGCRFCGSPCAYREAIEPFTNDRRLVMPLQQAVLEFDSLPKHSDGSETWRRVVDACFSASRAAGLTDNVDAAWCFMVHGFAYPFTTHMRHMFLRAVEG